MASRSADDRDHVPTSVTTLLRAADAAQADLREDDARAFVDWIYVLLEEQASMHAWETPAALVA